MWQDMALHRTFSVLHETYIRISFHKLVVPVVLLCAIVDVTSSTQYYFCALVPSKLFNIVRIVKGKGDRSPKLRPPAAPPPLTGLLMYKSKKTADSQPYTISYSTIIELLFSSRSSISTLTVNSFTSLRSSNHTFPAAGARCV